MLRITNLDTNTPAFAGLRTGTANQRIMDSKNRTKRPDLVLPDLSFEVVGACFEAYNEVGFGHKEKVYYKAIAICLEKRGLPFIQQKKIPLFCHGKKIGDYVFDFVIADQIILELKVGDRFKLSDYKQLKSYLISLNKPLGLLVRFGEDGVTYNRILPPTQPKFVDSRAHPKSQTKEGVKIRDS